MSQPPRGKSSNLTPYYSDEWVTIFHGDARTLLHDVLAWSSERPVFVTDPPYGVDLQSGWDGRHGDCRIDGDQTTELRDWLIDNLDGAPAAICGSPRIVAPPCRGILAWDKGEHVGMGDLKFPWKPNWEEIYILGPGWHGERSSGVLRHLAVAGCVGTVKSRHHPTEKPVPLMQDIIRKAPGGVIVDPFMGSGTTLRAAKNLGRVSIGIELREDYCRTAVERLAQEVLAA